MKECEAYAALLSAYFDGACTETEVAGVRAHLAVCPDCRAALVELAELRAAFPSAEDMEVPDGFADGVMARIRASAPQTQKVVPFRKPAPTRRFFRFALPAAACLALVAAVGLLPRFGFSDSTASPTAENSLRSAASAESGDQQMRTFAAESSEDSTLASSHSASADKPKASSDTEAVAPSASFSTGTPPIVAAAGGGGASGSDSSAGAAAGAPDSGVSNSAGDETVDVAPENTEDGTEVPSLAASAAQSVGEAVSAPDPTAYAKALTLTAEETGTALDAYFGTIYLTDAGTAETFYELSEADFDALAAAFPSAAVTENPGAETALCCVVVLSES